MTDTADIYDDDTPLEPDGTRQTMDALVRRWIRAKAQLDETAAPFEQAIRSFAARQDAACAPLAQRVLELQEMVRQNALRLLDHEPRVKSWKLPHGTVQSRHLSAEIMVDNEREFLAWAEDAAPELLVHTPKIDRRAVKTRLTILPDGQTVVTTDGETVPGVIVRAERTSVTISPATDDNPGEEF